MLKQFVSTPVIYFEGLVRNIPEINTILVILFTFMKIQLDLLHAYPP